MTRPVVDINEINARFAEIAAKDARELNRVPGEHRSNQLIRCPACGWRSTPAMADLYEVYDEGSHEIQCQCCDHSFTVETRVTHAFTSPARTPR